MTSANSLRDDTRTTQTINFTLNGERQTLRVPSHRLLLDLLRDVIGLTGTKEGCGTGDCGACTAMLNGRPVNTCLIFCWRAGRVTRKNNRGFAKRRRATSRAKGICN